ncbi:hypothetical protein [Ehrlichia canis]|uniref:hypothetical protein n=1 Tax=Ehrlichia canis TaxID=944 RepID=UPI00003A843F|nr:hypothetical protein [Ehrlichia canis]UKC53886.1 hypothetical protein s20019040002_000931 [Ehrlichia canis]UKC54822.1 hypothetical protein s20026770001_000930 [Ehrlichia canis]UKC55758.1 hypothetical protein s21009500007_000930 [Ehrlichia canis]
MDNGLYEYQIVTVLHLLALSRSEDIDRFFSVVKLRQNNYIPDLEKISNVSNRLL